MKKILLLILALSIGISLQANAKDTERNYMEVLQEEEDNFLLVCNHTKEICPTLNCDNRISVNIDLGFENMKKCIESPEMFDKFNTEDKTECIEKFFKRLQIFDEKVKEISSLSQMLDEGFHEYVQCNVFMDRALLQIIGRGRETSLRRYAEERCNLEKYTFDVEENILQADECIKKYHQKLDEYRKLR